MHDNSPLVAPSMYDGISALMVNELPFKAAYIGSWATSATTYGMPDLGYIGLRDMVDQVRRLRSVVDVPIIVDGEGGWGNPLHVDRSVRALEDAGASAVHIEDHDFGKHLGTPAVVPVREASDKIKAALDARKSEDFLVIARSDALGAEGLDATVDRLLEYQEVGADALFLTSQSLRDSTCDRLVQESRVPLVTINDPNYDAKQHGERGASMVLYYGITHFAAEKGIRDALTMLAQDGSTTTIESDSDFPNFDNFLGITEHRERAATYGLTF